MDHPFHVWAVFNLAVSHRGTQKGPLRKSVIFILMLVEGKIKMQQQEATRLNCHICHLWRKDGCVDYLGGTKACDPLRSFLSESERPRSAPGGPSNWLSLPGKIDQRDTNGRHLIV